MHASFPPFTRPNSAAPTNAHRAPAAEISDRESKLRTLKHYLHHAALLTDALIVAEQEAIVRDSRASGARVTAIKGGK